MIRIVGKGYKYLLKQLNDFLEISKIIVISLKSVDGRKKYEEQMRRNNEKLWKLGLTSSFLSFLL